MAPEELLDDPLLGEAFGDFHRWFHLTETDLANRVADGLEAGDESAFAATENDHHFFDQLFLLFDLLRELCVPFSFEAFDLFIVGALGAQLREGIRGELGEQMSHSPCSFRMFDDLFEGLLSHSWLLSVLSVNEL